MSHTVNQSTAIEVDLEQLHEALCQAHGVEDKSKAGVARALDTSRQWYGRAMRGESTVDQLLTWAAASGLEARLHVGGKLSFVYPRPERGPWVALLVEGDVLRPVLQRSSRVLEGEAARLPLPRHLGELVPKPAAVVVDAVSATIGSGSSDA